MQFEYWNRNAPASIDDIERVEKKIGALIPESYRRFILDENGGEPRFIEYPIADLGTCSDVNSFFGFGVGSEIESELEEFRHSDSFDSQILPIGCDGYGNLLLLDLRQGREDVLYWDRLGDFPQSSDGYDCYLIAHSFNEFLRILRPIDATG